MSYDVVIVGGGPGGLSAALTLGRARKRVLLCDSGPRRNAAAERIHNFVTRDGTPPQDFRAIGRQQLEAYANVEVRDDRVESISGSHSAFEVTLSSERVATRRVLLATGLVDEMVPIEGFRELWGQAIFQCPYCHGWEIRDRRWAYLARDPRHFLAFSILLRGWTSDVVLITNGAFELSEVDRDQLRAAGVRFETAPIARLIGGDHRMQSVELTDGTSVPCDALFTHPPQHQVELIVALGIALDDDGFVRIDSKTRETSLAGIYAAGDLTTGMQSAILAAASGMQAAAVMNSELTMELATTGAL